MGSLYNKIFGGDQHVIESPNYAPMTDAEKERISSLEGQIGSESSDQNDYELRDMLMSNLRDFIAQGYGPNPTDDQLKEATDFVDQTFTQPAQNQLKQYANDFTTTANAQAAALGRNPNADIATKQAIASAIAKASNNLNLQRGQEIQNQANNLNNLSYQRGLQTSGFLNDLAQAAFNNRLNLMNQTSNLNNYFQRERGQNNAGIQTDAGLIGNTANAFNSLSNLAKSAKGFAGSFGAGGSVSDLSNNLSGLFKSGIGYK